MIQHFCQAKMSSGNNSFHKSLHFSKSFKVFHCSVINVRCFVVNRDNFLSISAVQSFVNNFFIFSNSFLRACLTSNSSKCSIFSALHCCLTSQLRYNIMYILQCQPLISNFLYYFFFVLSIKEKSLLKPVYFAQQTLL